MRRTCTIEITQIMPAPGWRAVYANSDTASDEFYFFDPLVGWALTQHNSGGRLARPRTTPPREDSMTRWANTTDRVALNRDQVQLLMLMVSEKIAEATFADGSADDLVAQWEHIGSQIEILGRYHVCCACLSLVHEEDREVHPCGPCTCSQPVVTEPRP